MQKTQTIPSMRELMAAGAHFGHKRERSYPKSKQYTYALREGIYIIDLAKTQASLKEAIEYVNHLASTGKTILFVGTKPQAATIVEAAAKSVGQPYIVAHWPGGLLTNFETLVKNLKQLEELEMRLQNEEPSNLTKKEKRVLAEKINKANKIFGGVRTLKELPDALFVVDVVAEKTAVAEANRLGIPIVGICDTNANPGLISYPIPANDDAKKAIELIVGLVTEAIRANKKDPQPVQEMTHEDKIVTDELKPKRKRAVKKTEKTVESEDGN